MEQRQMVESMFENLHNEVGQNVEVLTWWNGKLLKSNGVLLEVSDYEKICVGGVYYPFIDYAKAIFYVRSDKGMLYLNPLVKDGYEVKPYYYVNEMRAKFFKDNENLSR